MPPVQITADEVVREADLAARPAMDRLTRASIELHERGYHAYSAAVGNMHGKIEKALSELVDEIGAA